MYRYAVRRGRTYLTIPIAGAASSGKAMQAAAERFRLVNGLHY